jgi:xanthine/uracil permease
MEQGLYCCFFISVTAGFSTTSITHTLKWVEVEHRLLFVDKLHLGIFVALLLYYIYNLISRMGRGQRKQNTCKAILQIQSS